MKKILILFGIPLLLCGCETDSNKGKDDNDFVSCSEMKKMLAEDDKVLLIDVRNGYEYEDGHLDGAINLEYSTIIEELGRTNDIDYKTKIIVYCKTGNRSDLAYHMLRNAGYENVYDLGAITNCPGN